MSRNRLVIKRAAPCGVGGVVGDAGYPLPRVGLCFLSMRYVYRGGGGQEGAHKETGWDIIES
jgi:hypothetical protein